MQLCQGYLVIKCCGALSLKVMCLGQLCTWWQKRFILNILYMIYFWIFFDQFGDHSKTQINRKDIAQFYFEVLIGGFAWGRPGLRTCHNVLYTKSLEALTLKDLRKNTCRRNRHFEPNLKEKWHRQYTKMFQPFPFLLVWNSGPHCVMLGSLCISAEWI